MVLKKRSGAATADEGSSKKKRKEEEPDEVEIPAPKKSKKKEQVKIELKDDVHISDEELREEHDLEKDPVEILDWPRKDMMELFQRIESQVPDHDNLSFNTRASRIDWEEVAFDSYSPAECKEMWDSVTKKIRRFRLLKEMVIDARHWVQKPWTNFYGGSKQQHHPDMPRRPLSQYMLYYMEKKDKIAEQNPNLQMTEVSKLIAEMYKSLSSNKKARYIRQAAELRDEYEEKLRQFYAKHPEIREEMNTKKTTKSTPKDVVGCPKPRPARMIYVDDMIKKHENSPGFDKEAVSQDAKDQWKNLADKKRLFYINLALEEEKKYQDALKTYCEENPNFEAPTFKSVLKKEEIVLKDKAAGKPPKPPSSGYSLYSRIMLAECPELRELPPSSRMQEISVRWGQMSEAEKNEYKKKVQYDREQYKLEYATYLESLTEDERQEELLKSQPKRSIRPVSAGTKSSSKVKASNTNTKGNLKIVDKKVSRPVLDRSYFPGEPMQPPAKAYDLFVQSFIHDTDLSEGDAPRFWDMLPRQDKAKFERKLKELKDQYIKDYEKFLKSLDMEQLSKYNELQRRNKAEAQKKRNLGSEDDDEGDSSEGEAADTNDVQNNQEESDSDEEEAKKSDSSSDSESSGSSSSNSDSSSSSGDSDSSSDDSDDDDKSKSNSAKKDSSDSDSSDED